MRKGHVTIYYGKGKGKTSIAVGRGLRAIGEGLRVVMIQFMDYYNSKEVSLLTKMEPDFRIFRFEKEREGMEAYDSTVEEHLRQEISAEIRNAFNFTNKIVDTGECEMLLLDGIMECVEMGYLSEREIIELIEKRPSYMDFILTGTILPDGLSNQSENIYQLVTEKENILE